MEKITNYLELIQQIQDITPEKEAFCTTGKSLTYSQLYALAKEKQGMLKQEKKEFGEQNAKKQLQGHQEKISCFSGPLEAGMIIFLCRMRFFI